MGKAKVTAEPGGQNIIIERDFDAPRDKVFKAFTTKELIEKWWVGPGYDIKVEKFEPHEGGSWRFVQLNNGEDYAVFHGAFHTVSPELTIQTFEFDGLPEKGHVSMDKMFLIEENGKTHMRIESTFMSAADRDGMIQNGMEAGMQNTYDQLDKVLEEM